MTEPDRAPPDVALLAALDADLLDPTRAHAVRAAALTDPRSAAVLAALAATRAELAALPIPTVPPGVAKRWAAALDAAAAAPHEAPSSHHRADPPSQGPVRRSGGGWRRAAADARRPGPARQHRRRLVAALVAAVLVVAVAGLVTRPTEPGVLTFAQVDLAALGTTAVGVRDLGALADPARRAGCLEMIGRTGGTPGDPVLGGRRVVMDGRPGVLLVLSTGTLGRFRLLVVDPVCGPGGGMLLAETVVGR